MRRATMALIGSAVSAWLLSSGPVAAQSTSHAGHESPASQPPASKPGEVHQHAPGDRKPEQPPFIPPITDADRKAAFPDFAGHAVHDTAVHAFALVDRLEWQASGAGSGLALDTRGWFGRDRDRFWFRAEGGGERGDVDEASAHALYGRQMWRWWDVVAGVRQDLRPGPAQTWAAVGLQGLAPYRFEVEATAYVGGSGRTQARFEIEYELLLTNRLVLQPRIEVELNGKSDPERRLGAGLSATDVGFRLRYEIRRELAPYIGVTWDEKWGGTADFARDDGDSTGGARLVAGVRFWF